MRLAEALQLAVCCLRHCTGSLYRHTSRIRLIFSDCLLTLPAQRILLALVRQRSRQKILCRQSGALDHLAQDGGSHSPAVVLPGHLGRRPHPPRKLRCTLCSLPNAPILGEVFSSLEQVVEPCFAECRQPCGFDASVSGTTLSGPNLTCIHVRAGTRQQLRVHAYKKSGGKPKGGYNNTEPNAKKKFCKVPASRPSRSSVFGTSPCRVL